MHAEHQDFLLRQSCDHAARDFDATLSWQADIKHCDVRLMLADQAVSVLAIGRLGDNDNVSGALKQAPVSFSYHRVIVNQYHA